MGLDCPRLKGEEYLEVSMAFLHADVRKLRLQSFFLDCPPEVATPTDQARS